MGTSLELWGGIECTRNRVGDTFHDQMQWNGHARRADDLDRIAALGIRTLRYPALWETVCPESPDNCNWSQVDERLARIRRLGIRPIVGLVHHGSGPKYTHLLDERFAEGLADYAEQFASRYPWINAYTPVNEPLTTARFSALYGHWYPHARDGLSFARALLNQCRATVLAMGAIRRVSPHAKFVQTEDLGKTHGTSALQYQVEFENERRWATFDLLSGRIDRHSPFGSYLLWLGIKPEELAWFQDHPCPPDILGINYYLTSERYLDENVEAYPLVTRGSNGQHEYSDVEAVRGLSEGIAGPLAILNESWQRYQRPLAITEAHLGCTREEQLRWLWEVWQAAQSAQRKGADVRAVTVWSLLGVYDWDSLVTAPRGHYEVGAFDVRSGVPRPTAIAKLAHTLANGGEPTSPILQRQGWWHRDERLLYCAARPAGRSGPSSPNDAPEGRGLLITGGNGTLGRALARVCAARGMVGHALSRNELDIANADQVAIALERLQPWAVINAAGYVRVDDAERDRRACLRENLLGSAILAKAAAELGIPLVTFSTDLVFDGERRNPYREGDAVRPLNTYGKSKALAERRVLELHPAALVVRTSAFFGPWDEYNFVTILLRELRAGRAFPAASDLVVSPTYVPDLANATLDLLIDGCIGIWHLSNESETTWASLAKAVTRQSGLDPSLVQERPARAFGWMAKRPPYSALGSQHGAIMPSLESAIVRYCTEAGAKGIAV